MKKVVVLLNGNYLCAVIPEDQVKGFFHKMRQSAVSTGDSHTLLDFGGISAIIRVDSIIGWYACDVNPADKLSEKVGAFVDAAKKEMGRGEEWQSAG